MSSAAVSCEVCTLGHQLPGPVSAPGPAAQAFGALPSVVIQTIGCIRTLVILLDAARGQSAMVRIMDGQSRPDLKAAKSSRVAARRPAAPDLNAPCLAPSMIGTQQRHDGTEQEVRGDSCLRQRLQLDRAGRVVRVRCAARRPRAGLGPGLCACHQLPRRRVHIHALPCTSHA